MQAARTVCEFHAGLQQAEQDYLCLQMQALSYSFHAHCSGNAKILLKVPDRLLYVLAPFAEAAGICNRDLMLYFYFLLLIVILCYF